MIDFNKLGRDLWSVRFLLDAASDSLAGDERLPDDAIQGHLEMIDAVSEQLKAICHTISRSSDDFCSGYVDADRQSVEKGRKWSQERVEKIALLRLAGDDTPEEHIPL